MVRILTDDRKLILSALRSIRLMRGYDLDYVAVHAHMDKSNLSRIERGKYSPSLDVILRICYALDCLPVFIPSIEISDE